MKTLLVLRHGKSSWKDAFLEDHERPLKKRGRRAAERMGHEVAERQLLPDLVLTSKAKRARQTARRWAEAGGFDGPIEATRKLYFTGVKKHLAVLAEVDDAVERVLIVGHNPDFEDLVERLTGQSTRMATASLAAIELAVERWSDIGPKTGSLTFVLHPRDLEPRDLEPTPEA